MHWRVIFIKNLVTNLQKGTETEKLTDKNCKTYNFKPSQLFYKILSIPSASYFVEITKDKQDETRPNQYIKYITIYIIQILVLMVLRYLNT